MEVVGPAEYSAGQTTGYDALREINLQEPTEALSFSPNTSYENYLRMHKVFVGRATADELVTISDDLSKEALPRYVTAAGWAAAEAALILGDESAGYRMDLLDRAEGLWTRALTTQLEFNRGNRPWIIEHSAPYRSALDLAVLPLLRGIVAGDVTDMTTRRVFQDCLNIAQANMVQLQLAAERRDFEAVGDHIGLGYECNALLSLNRLQHNSWFAIPAIARADTGYHHREQTHDLLVIRQKWGEIKTIVPVEIKASASVRDRNRYHALLVRGKMHLSVEGHHDPRSTLEAIAATYEENATDKQLKMANDVSARFVEMLNDYYAGDRLGKFVSSRTVTAFHDKSQVVARHPGLGVRVA